MLKVKINDKRTKVKVGDIVTFEIDGKEFIDQVKFVDYGVIEGHLFDLTYQNLKIKNQIS